MTSVNPASESVSSSHAWLLRPANVVTLSRIAASPLLFWFIIDAEPDRGASWGAFIFGWILGASDVYDGRLARRADDVSRSGAFLDPLADKIVVIGAMVCLVAVDGYWWLPVVIIAARELWISVQRVRFAREGLAVPARRSAKYKTFVQGLALAIAVFPPLSDERTVVDAALWVAVAFTAVTGLQYLIDGRNATSHTGA